MGLVFRINFMSLESIVIVGFGCFKILLTMVFCHFFFIAAKGS
jgi:hypothetical protein